MTFQKLPELLHWIQQRELVRKSKNDGLPKPWTKDVALQNFRFCNVRRRHDTVSSWLRRNWYPYHWQDTFVGAITLARLINEPATLEYIGYPPVWSVPFITRRAKEFRASGARVFNPAYIVSTAGRKMDKIDYVIEVASEAQHVKFKPHATLAQACEQLMEVKGLGSGFLAAQIIADIKCTPMLENALDWHTWCIPGPGSLRGMNRLCNQSIDTPWAKSSFRVYVNNLRKLIVDHLDEHLDAQDVQNCLCEFDKYMRIKEGGRAKQRYPGVK